MFELSLTTILLVVGVIFLFRTELGVFHRVATRSIAQLDEIVAVNCDENTANVEARYAKLVQRVQEQNLSTAQKYREWLVSREAPDVDLNA